MTGATGTGGSGTGGSGTGGSGTGGTGSGWDGPVVVGVDDSAHARRAVAWAAQEAARAGAPLRLVAVSGLAGEHLPGRAGRWQALERALDRARVVADGVSAAAAGGPGAGGPGTGGAGGSAGAAVAVESEVRAGAPVPVLADESRRARLVVLGDRGAGRVEGVLAGSVAMGLLGRAECPVAVVRGPEDRVPDRDRARPVVVGVDGTPASDAAAAFALRAAGGLGVALVAVHAVPDLPPGAAGVPAAPGGEASESPERRALERRVAALADAPGVEVHLVSAPGRAARRLLAESHRARLVVVGSRGRGELAGLLRGSVGSVLVHHAGCPVVVLGPRCRPLERVGTNVPITGDPGHCPPAGPSGSVGGVEVEERSWT